MLSRFSSIRSGLRLAASLGLLVLMLQTAFACSRQGEGERCVAGNDDTDCEAPLVCVLAEDLQVRDTDRCCPDVGESISDARCLRRSSAPNPTSGGPGPDAGADGGAGGEPAASGGMSGAGGEPNGTSSSGGAAGSPANDQGGAAGA
jgi:hypothetical protein